MIAAEVAELLNLQETELTKLYELLCNELDILKKRELTLLEQQATKKEKLLTGINQLDQSISQHATLTELKKDALFSKQISHITQLLNDCKKQNEINGQIINNSQIAIHRFKGMLQKSIANNSMTYDKKGLTNINIRSIGIKA